MRRSLISASWVLVVVFGLASSNAAAGQQPTQVRFDLADGNFIVGYSYAPPRLVGFPRAGKGHGTPVLVMIHGASDTHTVFDFSPGLPRRARAGGPGAAGAGASTASATVPAAIRTATRSTTRPAPATSTR